MSQLYANFPSYWNSNEEQISESLSKSLSLKVKSQSQLSYKSRPLGFKLHEQDSSSSQSTQSNHDLAAGGGANSQDQCLSSESGQEVSCRKRAEHQVKPVFLVGHRDAASNSPQMNCIPYPCADPYFSGLLTAYGPPPMIQSQMMGIAPARVPLPLDSITEDEPIYVNAKQYHGILRRRQSRAKLEAQNKLIKVRKPYLHESRHLHALNRVRGSGGRFLSTKKLQQFSSDSTTGTHSGPESGFGQHHSRGSGTGTSVNSSSGIIHLSNGNSVFQHPDHHSFSDVSAARIGGGAKLSNGGGFMNNSSNQHCAPVVR
ncbi:hypothetical protein Ancab_017942 [Ancistrocladus abbreviatus]